MTAILLVVLSAACWASADTFAKMMGESLPVIEVTWMRFVVHVAFVFLYYRGALAGVLNTVSWSMQIIRGVCSALSGLCFIYGMTFVPIAETTAIAFISPFLIMGMAALFLKDRVGIRRWIAALIGLIGVVLIVQPGTAAFQWAASFPALAALFASTMIILTRLLSDDGPMRTMFFTGIVGTVILSVMTLFVWVTPTFYELLLALGMGISAAFGNLSQITAYGRTKPAILAPFSYIQIVWAALFGMTVFGTWPSYMTYLGSAIIAGSGIYSALRERDESRAG
ncbi:MAG: DMT family transporter [Alphaproteobacteria bacterium]|nr:DMT family transporter [Alphaproteobacteria bacterium]